jgi:hypothetical protein
MTDLLGLSKPKGASLYLVHRVKPLYAFFGISIQESLILEHIAAIPAARTVDEDIMKLLILLACHLAGSFSILTSPDSQPCGNLERLY